MDVGTVVIGAGVVGLAVAETLARRGDSVLVLERHARFGQETSSHNSEVLHAGLYYPPGSFKARLCLEGNRRLREMHVRSGIPLRLVGKLVVGQADELQDLEALFTRARENGVEGLEMITRETLARQEPHVRASCALVSPHTGILDSHALMRFYLSQAEAHGADFVFRTEVIGLVPITGGYRVETVDETGAHGSVDADRVVNAAGLSADRIASRVGLDIDALGYRLRFCRGDYFSVHPRHWGKVGHLLYPIPGSQAAGLGIHVTLDLSGRMRLGPDTTWLEPGTPLSYAVNVASREPFARAVQRYLPVIQAEDLQPELAGIRPKLQVPGGAARDFVIAEEAAHGLPGFVNLIGIESPGLTASPAIARVVSELLPTG